MASTYERVRDVIMDKVADLQVRTASRHLWRSPSRNHRGIGGERRALVMPTTPRTLARMLWGPADAFKVCYYAGPLPWPQDRWSKAGQLERIGFVTAGVAGTAVTIQLARYFVGTR